MHEGIQVLVDLQPVNIRWNYGLSWHGRIMIGEVIGIIWFTYKSYSISIIRNCYQCWNYPGVKGYLQSSKFVFMKKIICQMSWNAFSLYLELFLYGILCSNMTSRSFTLNERGKGSSDMLLNFFDMSFIRNRLH